MMKKTTFSLPQDIYDNLTNLSNTLGISRSAFLSELLRESLEQMGVMMRQLEPNETDANILRYKGRSEAIIRDKIIELEQYADEVFKDGQ